MTTDGLEGVVVADTQLSDVDGERGRLVIRGHDVESLALAHDFEALCALLWTGALPSAAEHAELRARLGRARMRAFERLPRLGDALDGADGMEGLRASLAHLRASEIDARDVHAELTGAVAVFAAAWARVRRGVAPLACAAIASTSRAPSKRSRSPRSASAGPSAASPRTSSSTPR